jgi:hypothetical protein
MSTALIYCPLVNLNQEGERLKRCRKRDRRSLKKLDGYGEYRGKEVEKMWKGEKL